ncbi:hypothetical protein BDD12DRAFT_895779 [Trichophaea hybrida]|nr:hypothetical protein BDD12DRAFT_895779 [Trichophaea hybrida]
MSSQELHDAGHVAGSQDLPQTPCTQKLFWFRISNLPQEWAPKDLLDILEQADSSLHTLKDKDTAQVWLYPACSGGGQVALLNVFSNYPRLFRELDRTESKYLRVSGAGGEFGLLIDSHFFDLTPLNRPIGKITAE